jgi:hypothetical protein
LAPPRRPCLSRGPGPSLRPVDAPLGARACHSHPQTTHPPTGPAPAGHVVVAAHTVKGAGEVKVALPDQTSATARVVGLDVASDLAVLQLALPRTRAEALRPVALGSSAGLRIGQARAKARARVRPS